MRPCGSCWLEHRQAARFRSAWKRPVECGDLVRPKHDIAGRRLVYLLCLAIFFVGSWLVAASPGWPAAVALRVMQVFQDMYLSVLSTWIQYSALCVLLFGFLSEAKLREMKILKSMWR